MAIIKTTKQQRRTLVSAGRVTRAKYGEITGADPA